MGELFTHLFNPNDTRDSRHATRARRDTGNLKSHVRTNPSYFMS